MKAFSISSKGFQQSTPSNPASTESSPSKAEYHGANQGVVPHAPSGTLNVIKTLFFDDFKNYGFWNTLWKMFRLRESWVEKVWQGEGTQKMKERIYKLILSSLFFFPLSI